MKTFGRLRAPWTTRIGVTTALAASALALSAAPASAAANNVPLPVVAVNYEFPGFPKKLVDGTYKAKMFNVSDEAHVLVAVNLGPTCSDTITTPLKAKRFLNRVDSDEAFAEECPGGSLGGDVFAAPGSTGQGELSLEAGRMLYFCPIPTENGRPHYQLGMLGLTRVFSTAPPL